MDDPQKQPEISDPTYQDRDLRLNVVMSVVVISLAVTALTFVAMSRMFSTYRKRYVAREQQVSPLARERVVPKTVLLQVNEAADFKAYRASEDAVKNQYAWMDQDDGIVRIPVYRAMERVVEQGLPVSPEFLNNRTGE